MVHVTARLGNCWSTLEILEEVVRRKKVMLGADHPDTFMAMSALALAQIQHGSVETGLESLQQVVHQQESSLGNDHPDTLMAMTGLAEAHLKHGNHQTSLEISEDVLLRIQEARPGGQSPDIMFVMNLKATVEKIRKKC